MLARTRGAVWVMGIVLTVCSTSLASTSNEELFGNGVAALKRDDYEQAIASFEALADRGYNHPDVSYNRGLAYLGRVRAKAERPGDLGRSVAAFEETLLARPGDEDAEQATEIVRSELARRRSRRDGAELAARPSLDRAIVGLAPENVWAWSALVSSVLLAAGLVLRRAKRGAAHLAGVVITPLAAVAMILFAGVTAMAKHQRETTEIGVVVAPEARMLDERGASLSMEPIPEAARVEVRERRGNLTQVRYGGRQAWTHASSIRVLADGENGE